MVIPCPKCNASSTDLYQDNSTSQWRGWPHNAVLSCHTCGHRIYGEVALRYTETLWKKDQEEKAAAKTRAQEEERQRAAARATALREAQEKEAAESTRLEKKRARDRAYQKRKYWERKAAAQAQQEAMQCAWHECSEPHRETSKYCSRNCSNKNARLRAKIRKAAA